MLENVPKRISTPRQETVSEKKYACEGKIPVLPAMINKREKCLKFQTKEERTKIAATAEEGKREAVTLGEELEKSLWKVGHRKIEEDAFKINKAFGEQEKEQLLVEGNKSPWILVDDHLLREKLEEAEAVMKLLVKKLLNTKDKFDDGIQWWDKEEEIEQVKERVRQMRFTGKGFNIVDGKGEGKKKKRNNDKGKNGITTIWVAGFLRGKFIFGVGDAGLFGKKPISMLRVSELFFGDSFQPIQVYTQLQQGWLEDAAYFAAIDDSLNSFSWYDWPEPLKYRHLSALEDIYQNKENFIKIFIAQQFLFQRQWQRVRKYAQMKGVSIMGDMPIYVGYHSADVWANKKQFCLSRNCFPQLVSGVPPDAFSETGQLWGSPLYDWNAVEKNGFSWWIQRLQRAQNLYDEFRIDHFRGFSGFWAVPSEAKVAMVGRWKAGPGKSLFDAIFRAVGKINIIAEDLGVITEDVVELRKSIGAPGMAVLQFAFGGDATNPHLPHNHESNQVVYTGTHDNDTICGWWDNLKEREKLDVSKYLSITKENDMNWSLIQTALSSVARTAIIPMQDVLGLGSSARMNTPATQLGNWSWRVPSTTSFENLKAESTRLKDLLSMYGRL